MISRIRLFRLPFRPRFSLASLFVLTTLFGLGTWYWYQLPYAVEEKRRSLDPVCLQVSKADLDAYMQQPPQYREVHHFRRLPGGKRIEHGPYRGYDLKGNLLRTGQYINGRQHGDFLAFTPDGGKVRRETYVNGLLEGPSQAWSADGNPFYVNIYKNGERHGVSRQWHDNGALAHEERYEHGLRHGPFTYWRDSGAKLATGSFERDVPSNCWTWHPAGGTVATITGQWRAGRPDGRWQWLTADGQCYLAVDVDCGRVVWVEPDLISPRVLEEVIRNTDFLYAPGSLAEDFSPESDPRCMAIIADVQKLAMRAIDYWSKPDDHVFETMAVPATTPVPPELRSEPPLFLLTKMLACQGLGYDIRHGDFVIDRLEAITSWKDSTGVSDLRPPVGSTLNRELEASTYINLMEYPLRDVVTYLSACCGIEFRLELTPGAEGQPAADADLLVTAEFDRIKLKYALGQLLSDIRYKASLEGDTVVIEPQ